MNDIVIIISILGTKMNDIVIIISIIGVVMIFISFYIFILCVAYIDYLQKKNNRLSTKKE